MKFNRFVWELYMQSERGKNAIVRFSNLADEFVEDWCRVVEFEFDDEGKEQFQTSYFSMNIPQLFRDSVSKMNFKELDEATAYFIGSMMEEGIPFIMPDKTGKPIEVAGFPFQDGSDWYDYVTAVSFGLYQGQPEYFLPYNFRTTFNQVEEIHTAFGIPLPPVPGKADKVARSQYYAAINAVWQEFRLDHGLSPVEMCAFLYDFASEFITSLDTSDLPSPSKVWLITGGDDDIEYSDQATASSISVYAGSIAIRRGDILMLYLRSPRKSIDSVWRACTDGFIDPFFHYHGIVWICSQVKTPPVTFSELKQHPLLSEKPAVKAHFQGASSKAAFTIEEYEAILEIMKQKGQELSLLPRIPLNEQLPLLDLQNERDVELQLIEPFLERLGYKETDWVRQMPVKMGRGERNYPDYAFGAKTGRGEESARMVLESKYQLSAHREFVDAFYQTKSYALRLQSRMMAMAAREGVWIFPPENGTFDLKKYIHKTWADMANPDGFHEVLIRIGRDKILGR
ncbi:MAG: hypothetical protein WA081_18710 [Desulfosalsimonadaceae bacterium]